MVEFLTDLITIFEFLSFLASLVFCFRKNAPRYLKYFPAFLFITVVVELTAIILRLNKISRKPLYNFFSVFEILFYLFVLYHIISNERVKKIIFYSFILYSIISIINILTQRIKTFHSFTYSLGAIVLVCFCIYYFYSFFKQATSQKPGKEPAFWICLGLVFFYGCTMPWWAAYNFLHATRFEMNMFVLIIGITNYFLYSSFAIAFFIFYKLRKQQ
jgi:hypothetical protein